jgi:hypothetical protein
MLLATTSLFTAAVARFLRQVSMGGAPNLFHRTDVLVLAVVIYDLVSCGRVHPATLWGGAMVGRLQASAVLRGGCHVTVAGSLRI